MLRRCLKALACCASTVAVSGVVVSVAHADPVPPAPPAPSMSVAQLPPSPPEIVSGPLTSSTAGSTASPDAVVAVCDVFATFNWNPKPHFQGRGVSECVNPETDAPMSEEMEVEACLQFDNNGTVKNIHCDKAGRPPWSACSRPGSAAARHR
jgi:hypothetical protein